jgi:hypothetical protein
VRVRIFELRLVAAGLTGLWSLGAFYVIFGYRPGGPIDVLVGAAATIPTAIALAGVIWPPVTRGPRSFAGMICLGLGSGLLLVPSIGGVLNQLLARGPQTLLPSLEAAYAWLLALAATSLFTGLGISRRLLGETSLRRPRLVRGVLIGTGLTIAAGSVFATAAIANDLALRDRPATSSRFGPTSGDVQPPLCGEAIAAGADANLEMVLTGVVDRQAVGTVGLVGVRAGTDVHWTADVATQFATGRYGVTRIGQLGWTSGPGAKWIATGATTLDTALVDVQVLAVALAPGIRTTAEERGLELVEGARSRHCRVAVDGPTFLAAFPQARWLVGGDTLRRWRGELDFWVFTDGQLGQVTGSVSGPALALGVAGIEGTVAVTLTATDRDVPRSITAPVP